ncbi:MAG: nitrilase-related carbon-nitrogen hydrolase [Chitinophagaceae bacterium]
MMVNKIKPLWYLLIGIVIMFATHMTYSIDLAAWVSSVPFLIYLSITKGSKSRLLFVLTLIIAWSLSVSKILSPPMPVIMIFLFSVPISLFHLPGYLLWDRFKKYKWSFLLFPAVMVLMEWIQYTFTPFASWGVAAYTQSHNLTLMQSVSLFGMAGLSFLVYWVNISITEIVLSKKLKLQTFQLPIAVLLILVLFGSFRYEMSKSKGNDTITVAAVGTNSEVSGLPLPSKESNDTIKNILFQRTRVAAKAVAVLVVWNEAATFIFPNDEAAWKDSLSVLASTLKISLVASYVLPVSIAPLKYENKYLFIDSTGKIVYTYHKHQPVPGEPSMKGKEPLKVIEINGANIGGAICYDYDFPYLARGFGKLHADIVALPSSDWRGIDPLHSKMAAFRAIEQGHSILRSTRFGNSAAITPYGEIISQMSSFDKNDRIMIAHLPVKGVTTVYSIIGDVFIYICMIFILMFFVFKKT